MLFRFISFDWLIVGSLCMKLQVRVGKMFLLLGQMIGVQRLTTRALSGTVVPMIRDMLGVTDILAITVERTQRPCFHFH